MLEALFHACDMFIRYSQCRPFEEHSQTKILHLNKGAKKKKKKKPLASPQQTFTCSKTTKETLEEGVKYVHS